MEETSYPYEAKVNVRAIPSHFLKWLAFSRIKFLSEMKAGSPMRYFSAHLPVMATWRKGEPFPVNMTVKGIGLIPKKEYLNDYIDIFEGVAAEARTMSWEDSLNKRIEAMNKLYGDVENFDATLLGGLEIFEGRAFQNLKEEPYTSLLYVGMMPAEGGMQYISFQVNGRAEILDKGNPYYRFLLASRKLFEFDKFHLYQPDYPFGYLVNVLEVRDKSPFTKGGKP
ncbi:MAG: hypothetical protein HY756_12465 [Nitrospirae bacterium]|nr:hypothetical protein [Nitrospirota bacterium]